MISLFPFSKYFPILYYFFLFWSLYHMGSSFISLRSCLMSLKLFILFKICLSLFSSLFISFQVTLWWSVLICFCHGIVLVSFHLLLISASFHLRLIYIPLYQVLQIFDKNLSILAEILCHVTLQLVYQNTILNLLFEIPVSSFLQTFCPTQLMIFILPF